ncbi:MAG: GGDEF domain-containing protein [Candidatus Omnitrophica bacterium]|nr:GGDEF domain-containing protein [Candidatus Omnitrophota bacterium]
MLFWTVIAIGEVIFLIEAIVFLVWFRSQANKKRENLSKQVASLEASEFQIRTKLDNLESILAERFLFYDMTRRLAPLLDKKELFANFLQELSYLGPIETMELSTEIMPEEYLRFELGKGVREVLYLKTSSKKVAEYASYFVKILRLCLERIRLYDRLQQLSIYDSLTKIYNRRHFMQRFQEEFERAKKFKHNLAFLMIDIDHFKKVNDTYGHLVGDVILREVARLIKKSTRGIDLVARFGGEEFSVVLPETDKGGAIMLAERINQHINRAPISAFDEKIITKVSVGVASYPENAVNSDILLEVADKALYKAKISGRNRVSWF